MKSPSYHNTVSITQNRHQRNTRIPTGWGPENKEGENESNLKERSARDKEKQGRHTQTTRTTQTTPSGWARAGPTENDRPQPNKGVPERQNTTQTLRPSQIDQIEATDTTKGLKNSPKINWYEEGKEKEAIRPAKKVLNNPAPEIQRWIYYSETIVSIIETPEVQTGPSTNIKTHSEHPHLSSQPTRPYYYLPTNIH